MNAYVTVDNLIARYDRRSMLDLSGDDDQHEGQQANAQVAVDDAASELDGAIGGMYALPIPTPIPNILIRIVCAWAAYALYARRSDIPKGVREDKQWADGQVDKIRSGQMLIVVNGQPLPRQTMPKLQDSGFVDGRSQWDWLWGCPSPTGPSKGM
jgi:phage gp36-like protein